MKRNAKVVSFCQQELPSNFLRHSFVEDLAFIVFQLWVMILALSGVRFFKHWRLVEQAFC